MASDSNDLECTQAEHDKISAALAGIPGWDSNVVPWKQVGNTFFFVPETVAGTDGSGCPQAVLMFAKYVLAHP